MKRAFLIHGWEGYPKEGWRPWLKNELKKKKFKVEIPAMPDTKHPKMNAWVGYMKKVVSNPNKECYFIGHSLGCIAILRYIEGINNEVGGIVMVAGFSDNLGYEELSSFFEKPINWEKIRTARKL
jgi:predicted alpha/beta hydrolase family esterase